jgi:hypothetical protein
MALKRSEQQVDYVSQIGVNRGTGFSNMATALRRSANTYEQITEAVSTKLLKESKELGKKSGEEAAELATFTKENVKYFDKRSGEAKTFALHTKPPTFKGKTQSEADAYEELITKRHLELLATDFQSIIDEEERSSILAGDNGERFLEIVDPRIFMASIELPPNTRAYIEGAINKAKQSAYNNVEKQKIASDLQNQSNLLSDLENDFRQKILPYHQVGDKENVALAIQEHENDLKKFQAVNPTLLPDSELDRIIDTEKSLANLFELLSVAPNSNDPIEVKQSFLADVVGLEAVITGDIANYTMQDGTTITAKSLSDTANNNSDAIERFNDYLSELDDTVTTLTETQTKLNKDRQKVALNLIKNTEGQPISLFANDVATRKNMEILMLEDTIQDDYAKIYGKGFSEEEYRLNINGVQDNVAIYFAATQNILPQTVYDRLESAFENKDKVQLLEIFAPQTGPNNAGIGLRLNNLNNKAGDNRSFFYMEKTHKRSMNNIAEGINLGLSPENAIEQELELRSQNENQPAKKNAADNIARDIFGEGESYYTRRTEYIEDWLKNTFGGKRYDSDLMASATNAVDIAIASGNLSIRSNKELENQIAIVLNEWKNGSILGQTFGVSKTTVGTQLGENINYEESMVAHLPMENYFSITRKNAVRRTVSDMDWAKDIFQDIIDNSRFIKDNPDEQGRIEWIKDVKAVPIDDRLYVSVNDEIGNVADIRYKLVFVDENGLGQYLEDEDGDIIINIATDERFDFVNRVKEQEAEYLKEKTEKLEDLKLQREDFKISQQFKGTFYE